MKNELKPEFIKVCIRNRWVIPMDPDEGTLDQEDVTRLLLIRDLQLIMGVNDEAIPIILHLLDQLYWLKNQIRSR